MSTTRKLRKERDVQRGTTYGLLLDNWICRRDAVGSPDSITLLFNRLVADGRHNGVTVPSQPDGDS